MKIKAVSSEQLPGAGKSSGMHIRAQERGWGASSCLGPAAWVKAEVTSS